MNIFMLFETLCVLKIESMRNIEVIIQLLCSENLYQEKRERTEINYSIQQSPWISILLGKQIVTCKSWTSLPFYKDQSPACFITFSLPWKIFKTPHLTPQLQGHLLSSLCDWLFNIVPATLHIWRSSPSANLWMCHPAVKRDPLTMGNGSESCIIMDL
jgi:hypothetical protein